MWCGSRVCSGNSHCGKRSWSGAWCWTAAWGWTGRCTGQWRSPSPAFRCGSLDNHGWLRWRSSETGCGSLRSNRKQSAQTLTEGGSFLFVGVSYQNQWVSLLSTCSLSHLGSCQGNRGLKSLHLHLSWNHHTELHRKRERDRGDKQWFTADADKKSCREHMTLILSNFGAPVLGLTYQDIAGPDSSTFSLVRACRWYERCPGNAKRKCHVLTSKREDHPDTYLLNCEKHREEKKQN